MLKELSLPSFLEYSVCLNCCSQTHDLDIFFVLDVPGVVFPRQMGFISLIRLL